jgi:hypothetical protein
LLVTSPKKVYSIPPSNEKERINETKILSLFGVPVGKNTFEIPKKDATLKNTKIRAKK